jgi:pantoate--beta-alanine ligase
LTRASAAVFGEKDWQQLQVIRAMVRDEVLGVDVLAGPTVRETDGLAMASRNVFLSPKERAAAVAVPRAIAAAQECATPGEAERAMRRVLEGGGLAVEYAAVRDAESLMPLKPGGRDGRAVVVARSGLTRLLDNGPWPA